MLLVRSFFFFFGLEIFCWSCVNPSHSIFGSTEQLVSPITQLIQYNRVSASRPNNSSCTIELNPNTEYKTLNTSEFQHNILSRKSVLEGSVLFSLQQYNYCEQTTWFHFKWNVGVVLFLRFFFFFFHIKNITSSSFDMNTLCNNKLVDFIDYFYACIKLVRIIWFLHFSDVDEFYIVCFFFMPSSDWMSKTK